MKSDTEKVCQQDPDLWFSEDFADKKRAVALCGECPFRVACLKESEGQEFGIWGGVDKSNLVTKADYRRTAKSDRNTDVADMAKANPNMSKAEIGRRLGLARTTVTFILARVPVAA